MNKVTYGSKKRKACYYNKISGFINEDTKSIIGELVRNSFEVGKDQTDAWENQILELKNGLKRYGIEGYIIFEYDILRMGKRIDVVLLIKKIVFSLEFKNGKNTFTSKDAQQAEDYALDIKNFHKESENLYVCPILIATDAPKWSKEQRIDSYPDKQIYLQRENIETFIPKIKAIVGKYGEEGSIDFEKWLNSPYYPTPTIITAAIEAYKSHSLSDIAKSEAGQTDINQCEEKILEIIDYAKQNKKKCVCFITGVPGAGKTLVGLNIVAKNLNKKEDNLSVYISGNGPLVDVLREALIRSTKQTEDYIKGKTEASINALIQSSFAFKNDNVKFSRPTAEHILIFDEAQRVWNKDKMKSKHKDPEMCYSEPYLFYNIMDRHSDWAVMVCLVGLGQDMYDGEVGINEWFKCGIEEFKNWEMFYSSEIFMQSEDKHIDRAMIENCSRCHDYRELYLKTSIRSFRADKQCQFVDFLLDNDPNNAKIIYQQINDRYPVYITRDFDKAKKWVRSKVRGSQRSGVLACSSAQRLKPEGIYVPKDIDVKNWFLAPSDDLRSSNKLEIVASEFKVQGLEIDWAIVCWDADLRRESNDNRWDYYSFRGTKWRKRNSLIYQRYLLNSYRVLLTRARQGMIIFVPRGVDNEEDETRNHKYYDKIFDYLLKCGIKEI